MTAQICDNVQYQWRTFSLVGINGTGLVTLNELGLVPELFSTACKRGFVCTYRVADGVLILDEVEMGILSKTAQAIAAGKGQPLFGQLPRHVRQSHNDFIVYSRLQRPVPFSGGLLLADGFIYKLAVNMGFPPAWKFREVYELFFENGRLKEETDCSEAMARVRERMASRPLSPGPSASSDEMKKWIAEAFRLDYTERPEGERRSFTKKEEPGSKKKKKATLRRRRRVP